MIKELIKNVSADDEMIKSLVQRMSDMFNIDEKEAEQVVKDLCVARGKLFGLADDIIQEDGVPDKMKEIVFLDFMIILFEILLKANPLVLDMFLTGLVQRGAINIDIPALTGDTRH